MHQLALLKAIKEGLCTPEEIGSALRLSQAQVLTAAGILRGNGDKPDLICSFDGEPWALTIEGAQMLKELA